MVSGLVGESLPQAASRNAKAKAADRRRQSMREDIGNGAGHGDVQGAALMSPASNGVTWVDRPGMPGMRGNGSPMR